VKVFEEQIKIQEIGQEPIDFPLGGGPSLFKEIWLKFREKGLKLYAIGAKESAEQASSWSIQNELTYPVISDSEGEVYKKYGHGSVPYHVLIDRRFEIVISPESLDRDSLIRAIRTTL
jgi:hypothetical protein